MLLVKTYLGKSRIHGLGVFAGQSIRKDAKIWRFVYGFDRFYTRKRLAKLPNAARDYIKLHGYQWKNEILLSMDYDTFMNHSENPNTYFRNGYVLARSNIRKGEEITNDYRAFEASFCAAFLKKPKRPARQARAPITGLLLSAAFLACEFNAGSVPARAETRLGAPHFPHLASIRVAPCLIATFFRSIASLIRRSVSARISCFDMSPLSGPNSFVRFQFLALFSSFSRRRDR